MPMRPQKKRLRAMLAECGMRNLHSMNYVSRIVGSVMFLMCLCRKMTIGDVIGW